MRVILRSLDNILTWIFLSINYRYLAKKTVFFPVIYYSKLIKKIKKQKKFSKVVEAENIVKIKGIKIFIVVIKMNRTLFVVTIK